MRQFAPLLLVLASAVFAVSAYWQTLGYPFMLDDFPYIVWNSKLAGLHLSELWRLFTEPYNGLSEFLPLRELSYWFDITFFGLNSAAFRAHNIILFLLSLPLVYVTTLELWRYFRPTDSVGQASWAAAAVTALFALHPALVESVVWISGRKYVLPNLYALLALWFAICARRVQGLSVPHALAALLAFTAMMLAKTSYIAVAPIIALLWLMFWLDMPVPNRRRAQLLWPLAVLLIAACILLIFIANSEEGEPFYLDVKAVARTLAILGWLAKLAISPEGHHFYYPVLEDTFLPFRIALGVAVFAAATIAGVLVLRKRLLEGFALVAFFLLCVPYLQLIPYSAPSLVSDRFLALAVWPVMLLIVSLAWRLSPVPRTAILVLLALAWGFQTVERPKDWRDFEVLVDADLRTYPGYFMPAVYKITSFQLPRGMYREASETAERITDPKIREMMLDMIEVHHGGDNDAIANGKLQKAMILLWKLGHEVKQMPDQARWNFPEKNLWERMSFLLASEWKYLATRFPEDISIRYNAGLWMLDAQKYRDAITFLRDATGSPGLPIDLRGTAYERLGVALMKSGQVAEAETSLNAALKQMPPELRAYCSLAKIYQQSGRLEQAARASKNCTSGAK